VTLCAVFIAVIDCAR